MSLTIPEGVVSNGHVPVHFVPDVVDLAAPKVAEVTATGATQLDCYLTGGGITINKTNNTREVFRLCMTQAATKPGRKTYTLTLTGVYDGQDTVPAENALYNTLKEGTEGVLVIPWGHPSDEPLAAGVKADLIRGEVGSVTKNSPVQDEDLTVTIEWLGEAWEEDVAIAAA